MCDEVRDGIELAVGATRPAESDGSTARVPDWIAELNAHRMTAEEEAEYERIEREREARISATSIMQVARAFSVLAYRWHTERYETLLAGADTVLREAFEVALYDSTFIGAKLNRALDGHDRHTRDGEESDDRIQNDWNGSAKVALISLERSIAAWRVIAQSTGDETPAVLADQLTGLRREVENAFPDAWAFIRPGFDQAGR